MAKLRRQVTFTVSALTFKLIEDAAKETGFPKSHVVDSLILRGQALLCAEECLQALGILQNGDDSPEHMEHCRVLAAGADDLIRATDSTVLRACMVPLAAAIGQRDHAWLKATVEGAAK